MTHDIYIGENNHPQFPQDYDLNLTAPQLAEKIGAILSAELQATEESSTHIHIITRAPVIREFEFPVLVKIHANNREDAEDEIDDLADCIADTFPERIRGTAAVITEDHNILDRFQIDPRGTVVG